MKLKSFLVLFIGATILLTSGSSCKKVEGPGGAATIQGKIHIEQYDFADNLVNEYDAPKFDVYIIYGNDETNTYFDDDIETSYDGTFKFDYLEPGNYRIFMYRDCMTSEASTCYSGKKEMIIDVEITGKKDVVDLGTIDVFKRF